MAPKKLAEVCDGKKPLALSRASEIPGQILFAKLPRLFKWKALI